MRIFRNRRCIFGLLLFTIALLRTSKQTSVYAQSDIEDDLAEVNDNGDVYIVDRDDDASNDVIEAATTEKVEVEVEETPKTEDAPVAIEDAPAEALAEDTTEEEQSNAEEATEEIISTGQEEDGSASSTALINEVTESTKSRAMAFLGKAKDISPEKMKKVAAGALGIWGIAAGAGWIISNLYGDDD